MDAGYHLFPPPGTRLSTPMQHASAYTMSAHHYRISSLHYEKSSLCRFAICTFHLQASTLVLPSPILGMGLIVSLIYYWSRKNPDVEMSLMFGIRFKSIYFPWVLCAMRSVPPPCGLCTLLFLVATLCSLSSYRETAAS